MLQDASAKRIVGNIVLTSNRIILRSFALGQIPERLSKKALANNKTG
jgi:hypothetical protein